MQGLRESPTSALEESVGKRHGTLRPYTPTNLHANQTYVIFQKILIEDHAVRD